MNSYEMVHVLGYTGTWDVKKKTVLQGAIPGSEFKMLAQKNQQENDIAGKSCYFVAVGFLSRPELHRLASINSSSPAEFDSRHTMDGKISFVDSRSIGIIGYLPYELLETSLYAYVHHDDMQMLAEVHQSLLKYGECRTNPFRMRSKGDQWVWMKSYSYISYNHWNSKLGFFCSTNVVVGNNTGLASLREREKNLTQRQLQFSGDLTIPDISPHENQQHADVVMFDIGSEEMPAMLTDQQYSQNVSMTTEDRREHVSIDKGSTISTIGYLPHNNQSKPTGVLNSRASSADEANTKDTNAKHSKMSYEELEKFIGAQSQLYEQLMVKHTSLEDAISKQRQQLQVVQSRMQVNLYAQMTVGPGQHQEVFEEQSKKTKQFSELHRLQEATQSQLVKTLKERLKRVQQRNPKQLNDFLEKKPKLGNVSVSSPSQVCLSSSNVTSSTSSKTCSKQEFKLQPRELYSGRDKRFVAQDENQTVQPRVQSSAPERAQTIIQNPSIHQRNKKGDVFLAGDVRQVDARPAAPTFVHSAIPQHDHVQRNFLSPLPNAYHGNTNGQSFATSTSMVQGPRATLSNIENLLTASSQNPQAMQKLLSGLSSQPDVAYTLLNLLKQAQASGTNERNSLLFDQNLQRTTSQFSVALNREFVNTLNAQPTYKYDYNNWHHGRPMSESRTPHLGTTEQRIHKRNSNAVSSTSTQSTSLVDTTVQHSYFERTFGRQQEQCLLTNKQGENMPTNLTQQQLSIPSTRDLQRDESAFSPRLLSEEKSSWDSATNFELNGPDDQVLDLLLDESSMDTLFDPSTWPEADSLLKYLNMNLTSE